MKIKYKEDLSMWENLYIEIMEGISPWKPSFKWEDIGALELDIP
jgi:hypothetical protein